jgi:hypothetical protein
MARRGTFRNQRIDDKICLLLEERMETEHRRGSLNAYIEEILDKWVNGFIVESPTFKGEIQQQIEQNVVAGLERRLKKPTIAPRTVHRIGPTKGIMGDESNEGKRKAAS